MNEYIVINSAGQIETSLYLTSEYAKFSRKFYAKQEKRLLKIKK